MRRQGRLLRRVYGRLLYVLPRGFRAQWGGDMEQVFAERLAEVEGAASRFVVFLRSVADLLVHAGGVWFPRERGARQVTSERGGGGVLDAAVQDIRHAWRSLVRAPGFSALAIVTLALGMGATTAVFTVLDAVLLRPLPYRDADRLVAVWPEMNFNIAMVRRVSETVPALESVTGVSVWTMVIAGDGADPEEIDVGLVSANHFDVLGVRPILGRGFRPEEGWKGSGDVAVLSHDLWLRRYGGDPSIIGRRIPLAGASHAMRTVVGVLPPGHLSVVAGQNPAAWVPLEDTPGLPAVKDSSFYVNWRVGRLAAGASPEQAIAQLKAMAAGLRAELPSFISDEDIATVTVEPLRENRVGSTGSMLWILLGAVSLVLVIACANVANLLLARGETRLRELAMRRALGARRSRVIRQLFTESLLIAAIGGFSGVLVARALLSLILANLPPWFPDAGAIAIDPRVVVFAALLVVFSAVLFGLIPALRAGGAAAAEALRQGTRGAVGGRAHGVSSWLVGLEVALAVLLVTGATLMLRTLDQLGGVDPGFRSDGLVVLRPAPPGATVEDGVAMQQFHARVNERLRALPDIESVGSIQLLPLTWGNWRFPVTPEGFAVADDAPPPTANFRVITPGYFETMGIRLVNGRAIEPGDRMQTQHVAVINRSMADRFWPGADPIGRMVGTFANLDPWQVVGVVENVNQQSLDTPPVEEMYVSNEQLDWVVPLFTVIRVRGADPMRIAGSIRDAIWSVEPQTAISSFETYDSVLGRSAASRRFVTLLLGFFGLLALLLGAVGVYGVTAFTTARRVPEFGVRMALGASSRSVLESALFRSLGPVLVGIVAGSAIAAAGAGVLRSQLFGVGPRDPITFLIVPVLLGLVGVAAILVPAWKAARLDPVTVLRTE